MFSDLHKIEIFQQVELAFAYSATNVCSRNPVVLWHKRMAVMKTVSHVSSDDSYAMFEKMVRVMVGVKTDTPIFTTNTEGQLWGAYINSLPKDRQHYNCRSCQQFIERFGGLAQVGSDGQLDSLIWGKGPWPSFFDLSVEAMRDLVSRAKVTGVFLSDEKIWGKPKTGNWTHIHGRPDMPFKPPAGKTCEQVAADKLQDFGILKHGLYDYQIAVVEAAVRILEADALDRSEKTLGIAKWFLGVHLSALSAKGSRRDNLIWRAVAMAPPGWCHIRSSMISTLLDDIKEGKSFESIQAAWAKKMHPLKYQRPTAPVSDGQIQAANRRMEALQSAGALRRRFARFEEVQTFWLPTAEVVEPKKEGTGIFDHLRPRTFVPKIELPQQMMTWKRFQAEVLPNAKKLEFLVPFKGPFYGLVTTCEMNAPPILQWDGDPRNPVSWFFFHGGSYAGKWSLSQDQWVQINGLCYKPPHWYSPDKFKHHEEAIFMILDGCKLVHNCPGGSFFPENLLSEYHEIRAVMEAYSIRAVVSGRDEGNANGYALQKGDNFNVQIRVNETDKYLLDRWH